MVAQRHSEIRRDRNTVTDCVNFFCNLLCFKLFLYSGVVDRGVYRTQEYSEVLRSKQNDESLYFL